jgi:hypothetical protein
MSNHMGCSEKKERKMDELMFSIQKAAIMLRCTGAYESTAWNELLNE